MFENRSYLKLTQTSLSPPIETNRPLHKGIVTSKDTLMRTKLPPWVSCGLVEGRTVPKTSQIFPAALAFMNFISRPWTYTQKVALLKWSSSTELFLLYLSKTIKCLSKLHGSLLSTSSLLSNINSTILLPKLRTWKPFLERQSGVKVFAMASTLTTLLVKNLVAKKNS